MVSNMRCKINATTAFVSLMSIGVVLHILFIINPHLLSGAFSHQLFFCESFYGYEMLYSDFFYVLTAIDAGNPYVGELANAMYPPLANLFFLPFSFTGDYANMSLEEAQAYLPGLFSCTVYLVLIVAIYCYSLIRLGDKYSFKGLPLLLFLFSPSFLLGLQRANVVILAAAFINLFLFYYDSCDYRQRRIGLLCLCIAVALKMWPVLLGLLIVVNHRNKDTRWKEIGYCVLVTSLLMTIPFIFFKGGLRNIPVMINAFVDFSHYNALSFENGGWVLEFGIHNLALMVCSLFSYTNHSISLVSSISQVVSYLMIGVSLFLIIKDRLYWRRLLLMVIVVLMMCKTYYYGIYLIPVIVIFLGRRENTLLGIIYAILFFLFLNPFQCKYSFLSIETVINMALVLIWSVSLIHSCYDVIRGYDGGKNHSIS